MELSYREVHEIDQLRRRVETLENRCLELYEKHKLMYNVLKSKHSFLDFEFISESDDTEEDDDFYDNDPIIIQDDIEWMEDDIEEFEELFDMNALDDILERGL